MFNEIIAYFPSEDDFDIYVEAFGGGGSILFQKKVSPIEIYNDLEENVYSFFQVVADTKLFNKFRKKCELSLYSAQLRDEYRRSLKGDLSIIDRAYRFFYVNRTSVNGMGGFTVTANWVRRGYSKSISDYLSAVEGLEIAHERLRGVIVENRDAIDLIKKYDRPKSFFYLDPPYHHSTRTSARYDMDMDDDKQEELIDLLLNLKDAKVLLSGYNCELYKKLCEAGWTRFDFKVNTQTGTHKTKVKTESLWYNYELPDPNADLIEKPSSFKVNDYGTSGKKSLRKTKNKKDMTKHKKAKADTNKLLDAF